MVSRSLYRILLAKQTDLSRLKQVEILSVKRFRLTSLKLGEDFFKRSFPQDKLRRLIECKQVWVVCHHQIIVGFVIASIIGKLAYIEELDVLPQHGRKGLGTRLIKKVCSWAQQQGFKGVLLSTYRSIAWNAPLYQQLGFQILSDDKLTKPMRQIQEHERQSGFSIKQRVFMKLDLELKEKQPCH